ncbi:MAG: hypothetical protein M3333_00600 [Actinomycetota bacterium]|nr:hypothetical protein [Actinomycetota bacterium]
MVRRQLRVSARRTKAAKAALLWLALTLFACEGSGYSYISNSSTKTYFKVPEEWKLFERNEMMSGGSPAVSLQSLQGASDLWVVAFDAAPSPDLDNVLATSSQHPTGYALVRPLSEKERDTYSLASLRNEVVPLDRLEQADGRVEAVSEEDIELDGGAHGSRLVNKIKVGEEFFTLDQTGLVDSGTHRVYVLVIGCKAACYEANKSVIDQVADSWTIEES